MKYSLAIFIGLFILSIAVLLYYRSNVHGSTVIPPSADPKISGKVPIYTYRIVNIYPHDRKAFTQGLAFENGFLYEGTGFQGKSSLRKVKLENGAVLQIYKLPEQFFGEGITIYGDKIIQLTWRSRVGFVYDKKTFKLIKQFTYPTEGWGITNDGKRLIMSNGSSTLYFLDPNTFAQIGQIEVHDNNYYLTRLNELEYVQGEIYANILQSDYIARISPRTGEVTGWIDLRNILPPRYRRNRTHVLNGIAYDTQNNRLFVTGKFWPRLFEIELIPKSSEQ